MKSGVVSLISMERSPLVSEKGDSASSAAQPRPSNSRGAQARTVAAAPSALNITERRKVQMVVRADQSALQTFLSALASPSEMPYFSVARLVRIENEAQIGPARSPSAEAPVSQDVPTPDAGATNQPDSQPKPAPAGKQAAPADSRVVLGREILRAYIEIDLVKFLNPQTAAAARR